MEKGVFCSPFHCCPGPTFAKLLSENKTAARKGLAKEKEGDYTL
jgi:hypothetical protein